MKAYNAILESYIIDEPANEGVLLAFALTAAAITIAPIAIGAGACVIHGAHVRHLARKQEKSLNKHLKANSKSTTHINYGKETYLLLQKNQSDIVSIQYPAKSDELLKIFYRIETLYNQFTKHANETFKNPKDKNNLSLDKYLSIFQNMLQTLEYITKEVNTKIETIVADKDDMKESSLLSSSPMKILSVCAKLKYIENFVDSVFGELMDDEAEDRLSSNQRSMIQEIINRADDCQRRFMQLSKIGDQFIEKCNFKLKINK